MPYYKYVPPDCDENEEVKVYWDRTVHTDRFIEHNRPDIIIFDKNNKTANIIDMTVPNDHNIREARATKIAKYIDLAHEIRAIHQLKDVTIHPIVISCNGLVERHVKGELEKLKLTNVKQIIALTQKAVILGTTRTVRRALASE